LSESLPGGRIKMMASRHGPPTRECTVAEAPQDRDIL
jgi:hypothetical protein